MVRTMIRKKRFMVLVSLLLLIIVLLSINEIIKIKHIPKSFSHSNFINNNKIYSKPIDYDELIYKLNNEMIIQIQNESITQDDLKNLIVDKLNINFLLANLNNNFKGKSSEVTSHYESYIEKRVFLYDAEVGEIEVLVLLPKKDFLKSKKIPIIIGLHGHGSNPYEFKKEFFVDDFVNEGYAVFLPKFQAMDCYHECNISEELLINGFTSIGLNVYETLVVLEHIKNLDYIDKDRMGAIGHSAGSAVLNLVLRISNKINAAVIDFESDYSIKPRSNCCKSGIFHETVQGLYVYSTYINNYSNLQIPIAYFEYGYKNVTDKDEIINFFNINLKNNIKK